MKRLSRARRRTGNSANVLCFATPKSGDTKLLEKNLEDQINADLIARSLYLRETLRNEDEFRDTMNEICAGIDCH